MIFEFLIGLCTSPAFIVSAANVSHQKQTTSIILCLCENLTWPHVAYWDSIGSHINSGFLKLIFYPNKSINVTVNILIFFLFQ